ncbi:hypothetical protein CHS0354_002590 [Potamilus streckersoni]|uniref:THD domain-containing protein n=1 Tax=Potamilus streckersoni TaxID=2493646 RepID=A0AAE0RNK3_9BIVA|nr:hypothetical protein CHS0354_002590 [Potamilus streckersoni]
MAQGGNQLSAYKGFDVSNSRLNSILRTNSHTPINDSCSTNSSLPNNQYSASTNRLLNEKSGVRSNQLPDSHSSLSVNRERVNESDGKHCRLTSSDSGVSCKYMHYCSSSIEESNNLSENRAKRLSRRNGETRSKCVGFYLDSSANFTDKSIFVTDKDTDSDFESDSDLTFFNTESASPGQGNGDSDSPGNKYTSKLSRGSTGGNLTRGNNTTPKMQRYAYSGNSITPSNYGCSTKQANTPYNTNCKNDQISLLQHQQLPGLLYSIINQDHDSFQKDRPYHSQSKCEAIRSRCHREVDHNFDPLSCVPLADDSQDTELDPSCIVSHESSAAQREIQTLTTISKSIVCDTRSWYKNKAIKAFLVVLMVFNIILLLATGFLISMLLNQHIYQECPLCKDIMDHVKNLNGGNINDLGIQKHLNENDENGRCCLDYAFILKLMTQINSNQQELSENNTTFAETIIKMIRNAQQKAAIHLQSVPFTSEHSGQMSESIRWNFKEATNVENFWNKTDSDTEILIPLTGVYYVYAMVQYRHTNPNSTRGHDSRSTFEEFPLSASLYKKSKSESNRIRIGTVTLHCRFGSQSIEHNSIIQKILQLTSGDKLSLVVSNRQFLSNEQNKHQIGLFKVN